MPYFGNILVKISPNNNKMDIFRIYTKRAIEKCQRWNFQTPWKPRNTNNKSVYIFAGHPVYWFSSSGSEIYFSSGTKVLKLEGSSFEVRPSIHVVLNGYQDFLIHLSCFKARWDPIITRFHPPSSPHNPHSFRWTFHSQLSLGSLARFCRPQRQSPTQGISRHVGTKRPSL